MMWLSLLQLLSLVWLSLVQFQVEATTPSDFPDSHSSSTYGFDEMSNLIQRLDVLEQAAPDVMLGFYDSDLKTFSNGASTMTKNYCTQGQKHRRHRVCVTSTCYALLALPLLSNSKANTNSSTSISIREATTSLIAAPWRPDDLFQVPLLLYTILKVDPFFLREEIVTTKVKRRLQQLIAAVLKARPHRRAGVRQEHSDYIIYQIAKVVALLKEAHHEGSLDQIYLPTSTSSSASNDKNNTLVQVSEDIFWALLRCAEVSSNELCRQLAYRTAGDSHSFDVIRLAYSLLTYVRSTDSLADLAGRDVSGEEAESREAVVAPFNKRSESLVRAALAAFFDEQNPQNGLWDKGQPIYKSFMGGQGRNMQHAFVFPVNTVGSLLCALPAEYFRPHLAALERTLQWMELHQTVELMHDYQDAEGQWYGKPLRGWSSPHFDPESGPNAWSTAQVIKCLVWMKRRICQLLHNDVLREFHGKRYSDQGIQTSAWNRLLDSDLGDPTRENCRTIKSVLEERVVGPFEMSITRPSYGAAYSAILFGPPGTAKSTICEALAQRMGYDFCVIDTASFLADGLSNVSARIRYVFSRLMALNKCIILFDEIEEFALNRETPGLSMESRMLTTAMLTAINDLRRNRQSIFFVATNRLRAFDSAITRPGRFDMQLFVGTPNLEARVLQFEQQLPKLDETKRQIVMDTYRIFLEANWTQDLMYMNYLEGRNFASACANLVRSRGTLDTQQMKDILQQQAAVMTVRGSAREEYMATMELSRL